MPSSKVRRFQKLIPSSLLVSLICAVPFGPVPAPGQQPSPPAASEASPAKGATSTLTTNAEERSLVAIRDLLASLTGIESEIATLRRTLAKAATQPERDSADAELQAKIAQRDQVRKDIETIATGVDLDYFAGVSTTPSDIAAEFEDFVRPIIGELKELTSKPREIEALRVSVTKQERQIEQARSAVAHISELLAAASDPSVVAELTNLYKSWLEKSTTAENDLRVAQFKLEDAQENRASPLASAREAVASFFRTRGRNFLAAVLAFILVWFSLRLLYRKIQAYSPIHRRRVRSFYVRFIDVSFHVFVFLAAIFSVLVVLYTASDWVLLGLVLIFLAGLAWASKQALPLFFEQAKMMLNLGSVREGERILIDGVPWLVKRINVYTDLENPALTGGKLRMPIRDLVPLHSRPFESREPWFPSAEGDWVILGDGTHGRVVQQTPEWVQLVLLGGIRKTYSVAGFLSQTPQNLSTSFRVSVTFGIDYRHQSIAATAPIAAFRTRLTRELGMIVETAEIVNIGVEFKEAAASSLNFAILADFAGSAAAKYQRLQRAIARICVEVCNDEGWVIPFTQVTVHQATPNPDTFVAKEN